MSPLPLQILTYFRHSLPIISEGSLVCHTYYNTISVYNGLLGIMTFTPRRVAAYTQVRECVHIIFTRERERERERESYSVIQGNRIYHPALLVFKIILCRIVPIQFLLIMSTQSNLKILYLICTKTSSQVRESEPKYTSSTINAIFGLPSHQFDD